MKDWRQKAACKGLMHLFYLPELTRSSIKHKRLIRERAIKAVQICQACPVYTECRQDTLETGYDSMIAGGLYPWEQGPIPFDTFGSNTRPPTDTPADSCGTISGYRTHIRRRQAPCAACREAHREGMAKWRALRN